MITVDKTAGAITGTGENAAKSALKEAAIDVDTTKCKSKTSWNKYTITGTVQKDGSIKFEYGSFVDTTPNDNFKTAMTK